MNLDRFSFMLQVNHPERLTQTIPDINCDCLGSKHTQEVGRIIITQRFKGINKKNLQKRVTGRTGSLTGEVRDI